MSLRVRLGIVLALALAGAVLSVLLLQQHHGAGDAVASLCAEAGGGGCDAVNRSSWSEFLGMPLAAIGLLFYSSLLALAAIGLLAEPEPRRGLAGLGLGLVGLALVIDLTLFGVQALAIGAWCALCLATYALNAVAFGVLWSERTAGAARALPDAPAGRLALGAWGLASIAASLFAASLSLAYAAEGELRQATLLDSPAASSPTRPSEPAGVDASPTTAEADTQAASPGPEATETDAPDLEPEPAETDPPGAEVERLRAELERARAQARELMETLDDPQKLQRYRSDQAVAAFRQAETVTLDLEGTPFKGPAQAPIRVVEFSDFLCPFCRNLAGALAGYLPGSSGRVAVYYKHYPLDPACNKSVQGGHPGSCNLALGGICAERMGSFWQYHDRVFSEPPENPSPADVADLGFAAGLDRAAFLKCLAEPSVRQQLDANLAEGRRLGVTGTPSVFINGKRLERIGDFVRIIDLEAERLGLAPAGN